MKRRARLGLAIALVAPLSAVALATASPDALADATPVSAMSFDAAPVFATGASLPTGWNELVVRLRNAGGGQVRGQVSVVCGGPMHEGRGYRASAPFQVGPATSVILRLPIHVATWGAVTVTLTDDAGQVLGSSGLTTGQATGPTLVDVSEVSRVRPGLLDVPVVPLYSPAPAGSLPHGAAGVAMQVGSPRYDPATGDPILPDRAALYAQADAVLVRSDTLTHLAGQELDALASFVLGGGTLALVVTRPEDLRHPTVTALAGGPVAEAAVSAVALHELVLPVPATPAGATSKPIPAAEKPATGTALAGFSGGNLRGSPYGSSAAYGLGQVHFLAFDPTSKPAAEDPWVIVRLLDLTRRAFDRRSSVAFRPGNEPPQASYGDGPYDGVRQRLDPNEGSRWAIGAATLLLCLYAVVAGPINFHLASKRGRPLRALRWLPVISAVAFGLIVGLGFAVKGVSGRARHLTLVEAGAGMSRGVARRFRGFYASHAKELTVHTSEPTSVVSMAVSAEEGQVPRLVVDRDGARLAEVAAFPWQTVVAREDGTATLEGGISILPDPSGAVVVNRSGRALRSAILRLPGGALSYFPRLEDGGRVTATASPGASATGFFATNPAARIWAASVGTPFTAGSLLCRGLHGQELHDVLEPDAPGLGAAWAALGEASGDLVNWFPDDVPVLLAQLDGGEGRLTDSGLRLDSDRLLVRVVGFGGKP